MAEAEELAVPGMHSERRKGGAGGGEPPLPSSAHPGSGGLILWSQGPLMEREWEDLDLVCGAEWEDPGVGESKALAMDHVNLASFLLLSF